MYFPKTILRPNSDYGELNLTDFEIVLLHRIEDKITDVVPTNYHPTHITKLKKRWHITQYGRLINTLAF